MPASFPLVVVVGSKGGVGATTVACGLFRLAEVPVVGVDLTGANHMAYFLETRAVALSSLILHRGQMPRRVERLLRRKSPLVAADLESTFYPDRVLEFLRLASARRAVVVDAGTEPSEGVLSLAARIVLVTIPDLRAAVRAERALRRWQQHGGKVAMVENRAGERPLANGAFALPEGGGGLGKLLRGEFGERLRKLARELFPPPQGDGAEEQRQRRGIIRSLVKQI